MKFIVSSTALFSHLQAVSRVINSKNALPILDCFLFQLEDGTLSVTVSDSETTMVTSVEVNESDSNGKFAVAAKTLLDALKEIPEQPLTFDIKPDTYEITVQYQNGKYSLMGQNADEFPQSATLGDNAVRVEMEAQILLGGINRSVFATADDELRPVMNPSLWRFLRLRPGNFPHVRLAQLASLYYRERSLFSRVMEAETLKDLKQIFAGHTSAYWEEHFMFGKSSPRREKSIGAGAKELIIINTVIPFLYAYGLHKADERLCERAASLLEELKAENNYVTRMWSGAGIPVQTAADSQALLQLQKEYCDKKKCLYCRFGYEYLRHK